MLKRFIFFTLLLALFFAPLSCSEIPENNDPVIGIWSRVEIVESNSGKTNIREEWIFNDAYLGRYHKYQGGVLQIRSDFSWEASAQGYTIQYPGLDREADQVRIVDDADPMALRTQEGFTLAHRE